MHHSRLIRTLAATAVGLAALAGVSACASAGGGDAGPRIIGAALPMTGPVAGTRSPPE